MRSRMATIGLLAIALLGLTPAIPPATADDHAVPAAPAVPMATESPSASPTPTPTSQYTPRAPRPDPEGDRWVQLAVVGGGSLLGAVVAFMIIGGLLRWRTRRRYRF